MFCDSGLYVSLTISLYIKVNSHKIYIRAIQLGSLVLECNLVINDYIRRNNVTQFIAFISFLFIRRGARGRRGGGVGKEITNYKKINYINGDVIVFSL